MVIISKEHCRLAQVCILSHLGLLDKKLLNKYLVDNGLLGHDIYNFVASKELSSIDYGSGALGHGINFGIGLALANANRNIYVLIGDGEIQEGSMWEAFLFIIHHNIRNITIIADRNYMQIDDYTKNIIDTSSNMKNIMETLGFDVLECNGHNIEEIEKCIKEDTKQPKFIIADTIKGKGMEFILDEVGFAMFHHSVLNTEQKNKIMESVCSGN